MSLRSLHLTLILLPLMVLLLCRAVPAESFEDDLGRTVEIAAPPERIISLAPSITEILFALGVERRVAGVTLFSDYPEEAKSKPVVGSYVNINLEQILSLSADLVIATSDGNPKSSIERLISMGIPVYVIAPPRSIDDIQQTIVAIGKVTGSEGEARKLVGAMAKRVETVRSRLEGAPPRSVFYQLARNPLLTVGSGTVIDSLITSAGGRNIAGDVSLSYPRFSREGVLAAAPEVIIISSMADRGESKAALAEWSEWNEIPAVTGGYLYFINPDLVHRAGPRIVEGLEELAAMIHPERFPRD